MHRYRAAIKHLQNSVKKVAGITRGLGSPQVESCVVSVARRLIHNLNGEELTMLASGVVPESIQDETITAELYRPTAPATSRALEIRPDRNYRWSARGGDLWMREKTRRQIENEECNVFIKIFVTTCYID